MRQLRNRWLLLSLPNRAGLRTCGKAILRKLVLGSFCLLSGLLVAWGLRAYLFARWAPLAAQACLGPQDATQLVFYLHGWDSEQVGLQERYSRAVLDRIARRLHVRIALPRAPGRRVEDANVLSWTTAGSAASNPAQQACVLEQVLAAGRRCSASAGPPIFVGFSNGGYWLTELLMQPMAPSLGTVITVGAAAGHWPSTQHAQAGSASLSILVGWFDVCNDCAGPDCLEQAFGQGSRVRKRRFLGWHFLPEQLLQDELAAALQAPM